MNQPFTCHSEPQEAAPFLAPLEPRWHFTSDDGHDDYALDHPEAEHLIDLYSEAGSPFTVTRFWVDPA